MKIGVVGSMKIGTSYIAVVLRREKLGRFPHQTCKCYSATASFVWTRGYKMQAAHSGQIVSINLMLGLKYIIVEVEMSRVQQQTWSEKVQSQQVQSHRCFPSRVISFWQINIAIKCS